MSLAILAAVRENTGPKRGDPGYLDSMPDRGSREATFPGAPPQREQLPLPDVPPFTAYVGNLTFELDSEDAVRDFFGDLDFLSVRILKDNTGKPKGFGYVEFPSKDKLKAALDRSGQSLQGRVIRVNVAEPPAQRRDAPPPSAAEESNQWRRSGPLPTRNDAPAPARRTSSFSPAEPGPDRDWSAARGARFTPAPPAPAHAGGDFRREGSGAGRVREPLPPSHADETDQWRSKKPLAELKPTPSGRDVPPHQRPGLESGQSSPGLADTESTWSRGTKLRAPVALEPPVRSTTNSPGEEQRDWRSPRATPAASQPGSADGGSPRLAPPAPQERKRLQLAPRSVPATPSTAGSADSDAAASGGRASIFGSAKPIDSAAKEAAAAAKLAQRDEERKKAREAELAKQKEEDEKAKQFAEERLKSIKAAQDKAQAEVSGGGRAAPAQQQQGQGRGSQGPRDRQQSNNASNRNAHPSRKGSSGPAAGAKDEEGFEAVRGGKGAASAASPAQAENRPKKDYNTRPQFSFAAAARAESFVEGQNDDEVEEAAKGVEGVKV
ncbi:translation initiation factor 4B [Kwoniella heveanensis CBS 569]|uniref:Translation initiation factor 4B n=1 Tax=Kwoniella heveanensis BCC8398 TaxID=1296120 RepID=A0A1B9GJP9_9TREE|nr:translation initiation factor 4B [Kwoniella heveanensis BCC8398]OCF40736.1 translation initiation factor 4B [Kwoniella heveanensis CBS 569]